MNRLPDPGHDPVALAAGPPAAQVSQHRVKVPGGSIYYCTQGTGPVLVLMGGGASNADTLGPFASRLAEHYTVVTYDRRGYSRSHVDDPAEPAGIPRHSDDARRLIADLGPGPVSVFGTSFGALIALDLAASAPAAIGTLVVHEPPLGQMLTGDDRQPFDLNLDAEKDAGSALDAIAASVGVSRGRTGGGSASRPEGSASRPEIRLADVELFIRRDVPAIGDYHLDLDRLRPISGRIIVAGSQDSRAFYPYQCALRLASHLGTPLAELPGNHAGMIQHPAEFAGHLQNLLRSMAPSGAGDGAYSEDGASEEVTK
jgi:pimeloyl-ACP methyl ester carboxylesterase